MYMLIALIFDSALYHLDEFDQITMGEDCLQTDLNIR